MKKIVLTIITVFVLSMSVSAQDRSNFKAGFSAGVPVGDVSEASSFSIGLDVNYHWGVSELLDLGAVTGFINAFGEDQSINFQFLPVAVSARIYPTYHFKFGIDGGYAVGVNSGNEGGLYYRPIIGYNITGNTELNASYVGINNSGTTFSIAMVGILFLF